jgi:hypothetical protein
VASELQPNFPFWADPQKERWRVWDGLTASLTLKPHELLDKKRKETVSLSDQMVNQVDQLFGRLVNRQKIFIQPIKIYKLVDKSRSSQVNPSLLSLSSFFYNRR